MTQNEWIIVLLLAGFILSIAHLLINRFHNLWSCVLALLAAFSVAPSIVEALGIWPDLWLHVFGLIGLPYQAVTLIALLAFLPLCLGSLITIWKTRYVPRASRWSFGILTLGVVAGLSIYVVLGFMLVQIGA